MENMARSRVVGKFTEKRENPRFMRAMKKEPKSEVALEEEYLRIPEVAAMFDISTTAAYRMAREGVIPTLRFHGLVRVPRNKLKEFIDAHSKDGTAA